jgi:hypothetical protein
MEALCSKIPAKNRSKLMFSKSIAFDMKPLLERLWTPSWLILRCFDPQIGGSNSIKTDAKNGQVFCAFLNPFWNDFGSHFGGQNRGSGKGPERVHGESTPKKIQDSPRDTQGHLTTPKRSFRASFEVLTGPIRACGLISDYPRETKKSSQTPHDTA